MNITKRMVEESIKMTHSQLIARQWKGLFSIVLEEGQDELIQYVMEDVLKEFRAIAPCRIVGYKMQEDLGWKDRYFYTIDILFT